MPPAPLPANEAERLAALRSYELLENDGIEALDGIVGLAAKLTGSPIALVSLVDDERQRFLSRCGLSASETHRNLAFCAHAIQWWGQKRTAETGQGGLPDPVGEA